MDASKLVADAVLGQDMKYVIVGGKVFCITPPSIKVILMAIRHLSQIDLSKEEYSKLELLSEYHKLKHLAQALAVIIRKKDGYLTRRLAERLLNGTVQELVGAFSIAVNMMGGADFFAVARLSKNITKMAATQK